MRLIENITNEAYQRHTVIFQESEIVLSLRYLSTVQVWVFNVEYKAKRVMGKKISIGVFHMLSNNLPFDFIATDESKNGIDPFRIDDFADGRCKLYMIEPDEMGVIRGDTVPL